MSHSTNSIVSSVNFCDVCNLSFETKKGLYRHQSYDFKYKELLEKMIDLRSSFADSDEDGAKTESPAKTESSAKTEASAKTIERMYDSDGDFIYAKPFTETETETKDINKTKPSIKTKNKTEDKCKKMNVKNVMKNFKIK